MRYMRAMKFLAVSCITVALVGCGSAGTLSENVDATEVGNSETASEPFEMTGEELLDLAAEASGTHKAAVEKGLIDDLENLHIPYDLQTILDLFGDLLERSKYLISFEKITYNSKDAQGNKIKLSGLLIMPVKLFQKPSVPILAYQHGTELYRDFAPSKFMSDPLGVINFPEVIIAAAMASSGYAVAMPDYQGMGDSDDMQPYCHRIQGRHVVDMIRATKKRIKKPWKFGKWLSPVKWNKQLFLIGYSQGGYVTMQAAKRLQKKYSTKFPVTAVASLAGPHDLSGTMRELMLSHDAYKQPFFLPFVINGYHSVYQHSSDPVIASLLAPESVYAEPFDETLPPLLDGNTKSGTVNTAMGMSSDPLEFIVPRSVMNDEFIATLEDDDSEIVRVLKKNNSFRGWTPQMKMRMYHHVNDELVLHNNSVVAHEKFINKGAEDVELVDVDVDLDIREDSTDTYHAFAAPLIIFEAWGWLLDQR